jgi:hypothetical protein
MLAATLAAAPSLAQEGAGSSTPQHHHHGDSGSADLFPARETSGTAWQPALTPMHGLHRAVGEWQLMLHGNVFAQFLYEPGERHRTGGFATTQASSVNWIMGMARRPAGTGRVGLRGMLSIEPWTVTDCGYLNFLASGEMCDGDTIHDRQHPHDLFMELAAEYDRPLRGSLRWQVYGGLAGEPALGPSGFPHRLSSMSNPVAPITHHWLDATHITAGLVTTGIYDRQWKAEVSLFNGREPDEDRADLDLAPLDSVAGRLTVAASDRLTLQVSAGHLREAEAEFPPLPRTDLTRATASAAYYRPSSRGALVVTVAYGMNAGAEILPEGAVDLVTHAGLLEASFIRPAGHTFFGRTELVGKPAHDLHAHEFGSRVFTVGKLQAGYEHRLTTWKGVGAGVGGSASISIVPSELSAHYTGRVSPGFAVFVSIRPAGHDMRP